MEFIDSLHNSYFCLPEVLFMYRVSSIESSRLSLEFSGLKIGNMNILHQCGNQSLNKPAPDHYNSCEVKHPNGDREASSYSVAGRAERSLKY